VSGLFRVDLVRIDRRCPFCGAPRIPYTHPFNGTVIDYSACRPETCTRARVLALNGFRREPDILPLDDRERLRRPGWAQASNGVGGDAA
jgi:hypothetical protein